MKLFQISSPDGLVGFYCPGCKESHFVATKGSKAWGFNGDMDKPTFTPSILTWSDAVNVESSYNGLYIPATRCHSYIMNGMIQFLQDCTHELKGKTVEIPDRK